MRHDTIRYRQGQNDFNMGRVGQRPSNILDDEEYWWGVDDGFKDSSISLTHLDLENENNGSEWVDKNTVGAKIGAFVYNYAKSKKQSYALAFKGCGSLSALRNLAHQRTRKPDLELVVGLSKITGASFIEITGVTKAQYKKIGRSGIAE